MAPSPNPEEAPQALLALSTRLRQTAEATIVQAFRASIEGRGNGPTDDDLKVFARLVAYETRLRQRHAMAQPSEEEAAPPSPPSATAPVLKPARRRFSALVAASVIAFFAGAGAMRLQMPTAPSAATLSATATAPAATPSAPVVVATDGATPKQRPAVRPAPSSPVKVVRTAMSGTPWAVARCTGLNFFSRAICMNEACAKPNLHRQPVCADAVRQRRIDDARRNPLMLN